MISATVMSLASPTALRQGLLSVCMQSTQELGDPFFLAMIQHGEPHALERSSMISSSSTFFTQLLIIILFAAWSAREGSLTVYIAAVLPDAASLLTGLLFSKVFYRVWR